MNIADDRKYSIRKDPANLLWGCVLLSISNYLIALHLSMDADQKSSLCELSTSYRFGISCHWHLDNFQDRATEIKTCLSGKDSRVGGRKKLIWKMKSKACRIQAKTASRMLITMCRNLLGFFYLYCLHSALQYWNKGSLKLCIAALPSLMQGIIDASTKDYAKRCLLESWCDDNFR